MRQSDLHGNMQSVAEMTTSVAPGAAAQEPLSASAGDDEQQP